MTTYDPQFLDKYAELAVKIGVNLQEGQRLAIFSGGGMTGAPVQLAPLVRAVTKHAYRAGAKYVNVLWDDQQLHLLRLQHGRSASLEEFPDWRVQTLIEYMEAGDATLSIYAQDPDMMAGQDPEALRTLHRVAVDKVAPATVYTRNGLINWSIISGAIEPWAIKVFPDLAPEAAETRLWQKIFDICRVGAGDPIEAWRQHVDELAARSNYLNAKQYKALHFKAPGTDLTMGIPSGHIWTSGSWVAGNGIETVANIPTEEVFTLPHKEQINGFVTATKPLSHSGQLIEDFTLTFENGRVVSATAGKGQEALNAILDTDEGARSLGEVALVPHSSPISQSGLLFYNTLFDENASNHIALGNAYKFSLEGGTDMDDEAFAAAGGNKSKAHVDFMIGSQQMDVDGLTEEGTAEATMRSGEWAYEV
jgi:aminopeptidase